MPELNFYAQEDVEDMQFKFAVIVAEYKAKWIYCKHNMRDTWEIPGGHREPGEPIDATAKRELYEETGAAKFCIKPICAYSVQVNKCDDKSFGMLYHADIEELSDLPDSESVFRR